MLYEAAVRGQEKIRFVISTYIFFISIIVQLSIMEILFWLCSIVLPETVRLESNHLVDKPHQCDLHPIADFYIQQSFKRKLNIQAAHQRGRPLPSISCTSYARMCQDQKDISQRLSKKLTTLHDFCINSGLTILSWLSRLSIMSSLSFCL